MSLRHVLVSLRIPKVDQGGLVGAGWGIANLPHIFRYISLTLLVICICLLPGSNLKLPGTTHVMIIWLTCAAFGSWFFARLSEWRGPRAHEKSAWALAAAVCAFGWLVTCFPSAMVERLTGAILGLDRSPWLAFGTMDQAASVQGMISISNALMLLVMALDFGVERSCRIAMAMAVTVAGFITAAAGLCIHSPADLQALWKVPHVPSSVFGLFWYHGNTASFLNLSWPLGVWLCLKLLRNGLRSFKQQIMLSLLVVAVMVQIIGVCVNVSKMGHLLLALEIILLIGGGLLAWKPDLSMLPFGRWRFAVLIGIGVGLLVAGAWLSGAGVGLERWNVFAQRRFDDPARRHALVMALKIGLDHGATGTGPGTFEWVSVHYTAMDPLLKVGHWRHAHNDYAEFFAEWGWPGAGFFLMLLIFPLRRWLTTLRQVFAPASRQHEMSFHRRAGLICLSVAVISVLIHALVDFPLQIDAIRHLFAVVLGIGLALTHSTASRSTSGRSASGVRHPELVPWSFKEMK